MVDKDHQGYSNSSYVGIDPSAYDVWKSHDYWVVPWMQQEVEKEAVAVGRKIDSGGGGVGGGADGLSSSLSRAPEQTTSWVEWGRPQNSLGTPLTAVGT